MTTTQEPATQQPTTQGPDRRSVRTKDPRTQALRRFAASITAFTILGHVWLGFEQSYATPIVGVLAAYVFELLLESLQAVTENRPARYRGSFTTAFDFLLPAHITGLACAMLLYSNARLMPVVFAVAVAVASKYLVRVRIRGRVRHVLNPSNLGISVTLVLFSWVGISPPYHFTENVSGALDWIVPAAVFVAGTMLNVKLTRRAPLIAAWIAGFVAQAVVRAVFLDHALLGALMPLTGVAFVLFTNYMITDPGTTPMAPRRQVAFGLATAAVYGLLVSVHIVFGLFFALTIVCVLRAVAIAATNAVQRAGGSVSRPAGGGVTQSVAASAPARPSATGVRPVRADEQGEGR